VDTRKTPGEISHDRRRFLGTAGAAALAVGASQPAADRPEFPRERAIRAPARRYITYRAASMLTVPMAPARRPFATAASGVIGKFLVRMSGSNRCGGPGVYRSARRWPAAPGYAPG
jgi:hypothetical protein